jgi:Trypsin-like peptidase domain
MADDRSVWTAEQLVAELRARERAGAGAPAETARSFARFRTLSEIPTAELAKRAADLQRSIYGVDDRKETYEIKSAKTKQLVDASLALVEKDDLHKKDDGQWHLHTTSFKEEYNLCSSETFAAQPLGCFCSGVLVAPDVVATAGHCVKSNADLEHIRFVFGFRMVDADTARTAFPEKDVYRGKEVIRRKFTPDRTDWALVRLDRPVVGRKPVSLRGSGKVKNDERVFVIGHPCGLPQKLAGDARVRNNTHAAYFVANLDTYGGNSGSPVFNGANHQLEGLLVRGQKDFVKAGSCYVSLAYPTTGSGGEDVTRTTEWAPSVPKTEQAGPRRRKSAGKKR